MQKFLTICTPTFNRAFILSKLYDSLKKQTNQNFLWLVIDDGSSDETEVLVQKFRDENHLEIQYIFQENQGKHAAVNNGLRNTETDYFCVIDSDDYLSEVAVSEMEKLSLKIKNDESIAAFTFIHYSGKEEPDFNRFGKKEWIVSGRSNYKWEFSGEMVFCFKTEIHKKFLFPEFPGEKFCQESLIFRRIERRYKILFTDKIMAFGDYLPDGLTKNFYKMLLNNPNGALLNIKERLRYDRVSSDEKLDLAKTYLDIAGKSNQSFWKKYFGLNPFLILKVLTEKRFRK